jgi:hypothetical protein
MAADSLIGGNTGITDTLNQSTKDMLTGFLTDVPNGVTTRVGGATVVQGQGSADTTTHAGVLVESNAGVVGTLGTGTGIFDASINLPANVGLTFQGPGSVVTSAEANTYLLGLISAALPSTSTNPAVIAERAALENAVAIIQGHSSSDSVVRFFNVTDSTKAGTAAQDITITSDQTSTQHETLAINISAVHAGNTIVLGDVRSSVIVGAGSVRVSGTVPSTVIGDTSNQLITGGSGGTDTLVGGGGSDTLVGGTSADTFGFNAAGEYRVEKMGAGDLLGFSIPGISNINQLADLVTNFAVVNGDTTYTFVGGSTITLVGITPDQVTANLLHFTL